ncbi:hypothetical protein Taro_010611 [Colocasia esculenta]|uniref:Uncharacterized protein n=1 Tax=Colocasia esculenta TaxID=4460 RepID=A0A843TZD8_COLES|nr:hypothetical protein [Colocasia esculenta]
MQLKFVHRSSTQWPLTPRFAAADRDYFSMRRRLGPHALIAQDLLLLLVRLLYRLHMPVPPPPSLLPYLLPRLPNLWFKWDNLWLGHHVENCGIWVQVSRLRAHLCHWRMAEDEIRREWCKVIGFVGIQTRFPVEDVDTARMSSSVGLHHRFPFHFDSSSRAQQSLFFFSTKDRNKNPFRHPLGRRDRFGFQIRDWQNQSDVSKMAALRREVMEYDDFMLF